jgi:hypothetical protein
VPYALYSMAGRLICGGQIGHDAAVLVLPRLRSGGYVLRPRAGDGTYTERMLRM